MERFFSLVILVYFNNFDCVIGFCCASPLKGKREHSRLDLLSGNLGYEAGFGAIPLRWDGLSGTTFVVPTAHCGSFLLVLCARRCDVASWGLLSGCKYWERDRAKLSNKYRPHDGLDVRST